MCRLLLHNVSETLVSQCSLCFIYSLVFIILFLEDEYTKASWIARREALLLDSLSFSSHTINLTHEDFLLLLWGGGGGNGRDSDFMVMSLVGLSEQASVMGIIHKEAI